MSCAKCQEARFSATFRLLTEEQERDPIVRFRTHLSESGQSGMEIDCPYPDRH